MKSICGILALTLTWATVSAPAAFAAVPVMQPTRAIVPQIASASPSQIATSTNTTTISINGSGFDPSARVEVMFDVGSGSGQWRLPRHGFQVVSPTQIRLTVMPGTDPDQLQIRVVSGSGTSNLASVRIVASAPKPVATPQPSVPVTQPSTTTAGSTLPMVPSIQPKTVTPQATSALPTPKIATITPSSLTVSTLTQTITINGSGFDRDARVEWMYGVGSGAGQWRTPRNTPEVLNSTQIRVSMQSGNDPDQMQIRVINRQGTSNVGNLTIVKSAPIAAAAPTVQTRSASPAQPSLSLTPPVLPKPSIGNMAGTTPQTSPPGQLQRPVTYCGNEWKLQAALQVAEVLQATIAGGYSFDTACRRHDTCYDDCKTAKSDCDIRLRSDAKAVCATAGNKLFCDGGEWIFYKAVSTFGDSAFKQARNSCPSSSVSNSAVNNSAQTLKSASEPAVTTALVSAVAQQVPKISGIAPPSLPISTQAQALTINGSGFDKDTRVEWMYGVGPGANQWRSPRDVPEVLSGTQIRVMMRSGNDPDQMQIRVVNKQGYSNIGNLSIVKSAATAQSVVTPLTANKATVPTLNSAPSPLTGAGGLSPTAISKVSTVATTSKSPTVTPVVAPTITTTPGTAEPTPTISNVVGTAYKVICPEKICNRSWDDYLLVGYAGQPYKEITIEGNNLDKIKTVTSSAGYSAAIIGSPTKKNLKLHITANSYRTPPTSNLTITLNNDSKLTAAIKVIPTFNDYQVYGQCTWYAWHVRRKENSQNEITSYSAGTAIQKNSLEIALPRANSIIMNPVKQHTAYVESVTTSAPTTNADKSTTVTYTLSVTDANWGQDRNSVGRAFTTTMSVTTSADRKKLTVTNYPTAGYEMTHVYY